MRLLIVFSMLLALAVSLRLVFFIGTPEYKVGMNLSRTITLFDDPTYTGGKQSFYLGSVRVLLPPSPRLQYGDTIRFRGTITEKRFTGSYGAIITSLQLEETNFKKLKSPVYIRTAAWVRSRITTAVEVLLPPNEATLLLGITLGIKHGFDRDFYSQLKQTGVLHIVAASGSNVSLLAAFLLPLFQYLMSRKTALACTGISIIFYALLSGFDPSILRASLMAVVSFAALTLGRQNTAVYTLFLVASGMLLFDPSLIANVGFQLSVTATLGILLIKHKLDSLKVLRAFPIVKEDLNTTLSAQWGSLPILVTQFGVFSPLSVVVNVLVLWMVPVLMILGLVISLLVLIQPILAVPLIYLSYPILKLFVTIIMLLAPLSIAVTASFYSPVFIASYYLITLSLMYAYQANTPQHTRSAKSDENNNIYLKTAK